MTCLLYLVRRKYSILLTVGSKQTGRVLMREVFSAFGFQVFNRIGKGESLIKQNSPFFLNIHVTLRVKTFLSPFCVGIRCLSLL